MRSLSAGLVTNLAPSLMSGIRLRYELNRHFLLITKFGETVYLDRNEIGSGNDLICGNKKADIQMQLRIKF